MIQVACNIPMQVGECPLWHPAQQALYWVDIPGFKVHRLHPASQQHQFWNMPSEPAAIAHGAGGGLVVAMRSGFARLDTGSGELSHIAPAPYDTALVRFNDGRCDAAGRFWVGTMYEPRDQQLAQMFCLERGQLRCVWQGGMTVSNGLAFSPDNRTLYHADTTSHTLRSYDFDVASGQVGQPRLLRQFSTDRQHAYGGRPDGAAVDSEGAYWCAMFEGGRLLRLAPDGALLQEISLPLRCPTMLAFGGEDLRTLYITSAGNRPAAELAHYPLSGQLLALRVAVAGLAEHSYLD
jgi:sugar lactone lactonase YvrE